MGIMRARKAVFRVLRLRPEDEFLTGRPQGRGGGFTHFGER
jgi:hypothetical protein